MVRCFGNILALKISKIYMVCYTSRVTDRNVFCDVIGEEMSRVIL